jgi:hypothetical protein
LPRFWRRSAPRLGRSRITTIKLAGNLPTRRSPPCATKPIPKRSAAPSLAPALGRRSVARLAAVGAPGSARPPGRSSAPELVQPTRRMRQGTCSSNTTPIMRSAWPLGDLRRRNIPHQDRVMPRRRVMDRPQVTPPSRAIRHRLRTRLGNEVFPVGRCQTPAWPACATNCGLLRRKPRRHGPAARRLNPDNGDDRRQ